MKEVPTEAAPVASSLTGYLYVEENALFIHPAASGAHSYCWIDPGPALWQTAAFELIHFRVMKRPSMR
jgi:hypothetical protein